jgi:hypothetical protein
MGYNNENARRLVFDIETCPLETAGDFLEPVKAPANYKDQAKIDAYIAEGNSTELSKCALDVDLCRVAAIATWTEGEPRPQSTHLGMDAEVEMLEAFWKVADGKHLVGFNCIGFDLPVLLRRSLYLGVKPLPIQVDRYKHPQVTDLLQVLSFNGLLRLRGLSFYAKRFDLDIADPLGGVDIPQAVAEERWAEIDHHVRCDVEKTAAIAAKLGHFSKAQLEMAL